MQLEVVMPVSPGWTSGCAPLRLMCRGRERQRHKAQRMRWNLCSRVASWATRAANPGC